MHFSYVNPITFPELFPALSSFSLDDFWHLFPRKRCKSGRWCFDCCGCSWGLFWFTCFAHIFGMCSCTSCIQFFHCCPGPIIFRIWTNCFIFPGVEPVNIIFFSSLDFPTQLPVYFWLYKLSCWYSIITFNLPYSFDGTKSQILYIIIQNVSKWYFDVWHSETAASYMSC